MIALLWSLALALSLGATAAKGSQLHHDGSLERPRFHNPSPLFGAGDTSRFPAPNGDLSGYSGLLEPALRPRASLTTLRGRRRLQQATAVPQGTDPRATADPNPVAAPASTPAGLPPGTQVPEPPQLPAPVGPPPAPPGRRPCSESCYQRATCNEELGRCDCPKQLKGADCQSNASASFVSYFSQGAEQEAARPMPCLNLCNDRGKCVMGECVCERGFFGADCSLSIGPSGKPIILEGTGYEPRAQRPYIYVYDIPHRYSSWHNPRRMDREVHWTIWQRMLRARVLVADGDEADWFFIPVKMRNTADGPKLTAMISYIRKHWPWYDRLHGHRHFVIHMGDTGRGEVQEDIRQVALNITWLHHWGLYEDYPSSGWRAGHRPGKDIVIPVGFKGKVYKDVLGFTTLHPRAPDLQRDSQLLFAGRICGDKQPPSLTQPWPHCRTDKSMGYSQGARQAVHYHHHNRTGYRLVTFSPTYLLDLMRFKWCLAPSGGGHGHRQTLSAAMGCLPVVVSDLVMQPFEPEMDWSAFSVRVPQEEVPSMHKKLEAIDDEAYDRMQAAVQCAAQHLMYSSSKGALMQEDGRWDAFESIVEILRMQQLNPGVVPAEYGRLDERFRYFMGCGHEDMAAYGFVSRLARREKYPVPLERQLYGNSNKTLDWSVMYAGGLGVLLKRAAAKVAVVREGRGGGGDGKNASTTAGEMGKGSGGGVVGGGVSLCSISRWDVQTDRCHCELYKDCFEAGSQV